MSVHARPHACIYLDIGGSFVSSSCFEISPTTDFASEVQRVNMSYFDLLTRAIISVSRRGRESVTDTVTHTDSD